MRLLLRFAMIFFGTLLAAGLLALADTPHADAALGAGMPGPQAALHRPDGPQGAR